MKKLLSLPENLVSSFCDLEEKSANEWFCSSDPKGEKIGSGSGSAWLLDQARKKESSPLLFADWLASERRILIHAGGQSRRLPAYAPSGKILTPIPAFRWARGQKINQNLLDLQVPLYERIMNVAPPGVNTLIASGDVLITTESDDLVVPQADVVCFGLWINPEQATNHGVFFCDRQEPEKLQFMLQKPSVARIRELAPDYYFLMDIGIWLLSDRAVDILMRRSGWSSENRSFTPRFYDLYSEFGPALGKFPPIQDEEINRLSIKILPLEGGKFYHFGTGKDLLTSTLRIQNRVIDQRSIWNHNIKPHPEIFVQNALTTGVSFSEINNSVWIENSCIGNGWCLHDHHILTGIPRNNWSVDLPSGVCLDIVPIGEDLFCIRPYGFMDRFSGNTNDKSTRWMGAPLLQWFEDRSVNPDWKEPVEVAASTDTAASDGFATSQKTDVQKARLFPIVKAKDLSDDLINWMIHPQHNARMVAFYRNAEKLSAEEISSRANLKRLYGQRAGFRKEVWPILAKNYRRSVFYQLDLDDAAREWSAMKLPLPTSLPESELPMIRIHDLMFRARVEHYNQLSDTSSDQKQKSVATTSDQSGKNQNPESKAFALLQKAILQNALREKVSPSLNVFSDQIVWGRSPARLDLAGGWTDTPPYCLINGGQVVNVAVELNGQPPLQVFIRPSEAFKITLRSIDLGQREMLSSFEELRNFSQVGSAFAIPKAALCLAGFYPDFCNEQYASLEEQLHAFGCGLELSLLSAIPKGSGLGTSSILAATVLGTLSDFCSLNWDKMTIGNRSLALEQLLTTGGGWQDQFGGLLPGLKLLETKPGLDQTPSVRWLPEELFCNAASQKSMLLYYTGITRVAKNILAEIVRGMFLNSGSHLEILHEMKQHAYATFEAIQKNDYTLLAEKIKRSWELNKRLDEGTNTSEIQSVIDKISDLILACKLPGAGGGGYMLILAKDPVAATRIRTILTQNPPNPRARFVDITLSHSGFQVTRS